MLLPENLYECSRYSQVEFQELQVELRNLDVYMDFYVNLSPITLSRNISPDQPNEEYFRIKRTRDLKNCVFIDGKRLINMRMTGLTIITRYQYLLTSFVWTITSIIYIFMSL